VEERHRYNHDRSLVGQTSVLHRDNPYMYVRYLCSDSSFFIYRAFSVSYASIMLAVLLKCVVLIFVYM